MLKKLGLSVLYGAAFALGMLMIIGVLLYGFSSLSISTLGGTTSDFPNSQPQRPTGEQLVIFNAKEVASSPDGASDSKCAQLSVVYPKQFTGTIENTGPDSDRYLNVYVDLFDKEGVFIFQCQTQFQEPLRHGEKQNFIIGCHSLPPEIMSKYSSFKVYARGG